MEFSHYSVLLRECLDGLHIDPEGRYVDGTAGGAGHSREIAKQLTTGRLYALDQDPDAVAVATERLAPYPQAKVIRTNFREMASVLEQEGALPVNGVLLDLGVSSWQLDNPERGFSYREDAPLDMRMAQDGETAAQLLDRADEAEISRILWEYGEERYARSIARNIVKAREKEPVATTMQLVEIIKSSMPAAARREKNPCKRTFQALRIAVNSELDALSQGIDAAFDCLAEGGRLCIITFHSLEDRMVKQKFAELARGCICPPEFPVCVCGRTPAAKLINKKPILPTPAELAVNHRSASAKLRILEKIHARSE
jgi:16S rRNA (cytosine1402-N4)-methyltransferase